VVELQTNLGTVAIRLDYANAPITADNFATYVASGFYENTLIHRAVKDFVVQGGGYSRVDGKLKATPTHRERSRQWPQQSCRNVAMARTSDPDSATSQFFVNWSTTPVSTTAAHQTGVCGFRACDQGNDHRPAIGALPTMSQLPFSANSTLVWIDAVHANDVWDKAVSQTRVTISGSGTVTSNPQDRLRHELQFQSAPRRSDQDQGNPASGYIFGGWRGDCQGGRPAIDLDTTKGNHNCTAQFNRQGPLLQ